MQATSRWSSSADQLGPPTLVSADQDRLAADLLEFDRHRRCPGNRR
ncbi:MAG: hypothetical protein NCA08_01610 [Deltaproteobacteria bacterium]|nr:hypothetical protein [Candidatus Deferrimicrobium borealis]